MQRQFLTPPVPRLLGLDYAATYLGVSVRTFEKLWKDGQIPEPQRIGRRLLWDRRMLDRHVDEISGFESEHENW